MKIAGITVSRDTVGLFNTTLHHFQTAWVRIPV